MVFVGLYYYGAWDSAVLRMVGAGRGIEIDRSATIKATKALTIPSTVGSA